MTIIDNASVLVGLGAWVPPQVVTNDELCVTLGTTPDWIETRTGIRQRRKVTGGLATSDLAVEAGNRALKSADLPGVDAVVIATNSPAQTELLRGKGVAV
jgi:3-oxoacyl-[acyl-carrier-protein] synthase-3